ncbi:MAG: signal recognition particle protein, partial [Candidatus Phytoplasma stylosanthis]|nr:signal recognition particle protein [Candidatus Phytoplasma stylosanthis]
SSEKHYDDNFEIFHPERIASRLLDMGDMETLIENVEEKINIKKNKEIFNKILDEDYNYNDLLKQLKLLQRIGSVKKILNFIPGMGSKIKNLPFLEENIIQKFRFIIQSMTIEERLKPILIENNNRRRTRIINGSGTKIIDINNLIQFIKKQKQISQQMRGLDLDNLNNPEDILKKIIN